MYDVLIIDGNNLYDKNFNKFIHLNTVINGQSIITGGIYGFLKSLQSLERKFLRNNGIVYVLFDNLNSKVEQRKEIDPDYKGNRVKKSSLYYKTIDLLQYLLVNYKNNYYIVYRTAYEADDLVKPIIEHLDEDKNILLVSDDQDWARLINYQNRNIHLYWKHQILNKQVYKDIFGYEPTYNSVTLYKTIRGDKSDNIPPGVPNIRETDLLKLISQFETIYDILNEIDNISYLSDTIKNLFKHNKARLRLNYQLVDFQPIYFEDLEEFISEGAFNKRILRMLYNSLNFHIAEIDNRFEDDYIDVEISTNPNDFFIVKKLNR